MLLNSVSAALQSVSFPLDTVAWQLDARSEATLEQQLESAEQLFEAPACPGTLTTTAPASAAPAPPGVQVTQTATSLEHAVTLPFELTV
jgi:hypothetical protein